MRASGYTAAIGELAELGDAIGRAASYASLRFSIDTQDPRNGALLARVQEKGTAIETTLLFFELEWAAVEDGRADALLAAEGLEAWTVPEVWVMAAGGSADHFVDITDVFDRKLAALRAHVSQTAHMDDLEGMLRGWLGANAVLAGLADGRLAEGFRIVSTK